MISPLISSILQKCGNFAYQINNQINEIYSSNYNALLQHYVCDGLQ